jgi:tRNA pseudouridine38-40 synthase
MILREEVKLTGAGRTDTGVHAREYYAHFDLQKELSPEEREKFRYNLNGFLPPDIVIFDVLPVADTAHARFSAVARTYQYFITLKKDPFLRNYAWHQYGNYDLELMNRGAEMLKRTVDFTSFSKVDTDTKTNNCKVTEAFWKQEGDLLVFTITADRFLRNMVRAVVGTLIEIGRGKLDLDGLQRIIDGKDRSLAGESVPACGLHLVKIGYPEKIFLL